MFESGSQMLQAVDLTLWRGDTCLFANLSLALPGGSALVIRGPNGAGKTTLLRVLCGLTRPETGTVLWMGEPATRAGGELLAYAGHQPGLKADLTVRQNLAFYLGLAGYREDQDGLFRLLALERCADLEVRHLSAGQKRRAGLARILASGRPAWLLDEPFTNMDQAGRRLIEARIAAHVTTGGMAIIVAHDEVQLPGVRAETLTMAGC